MIIYEEDLKKKYDQFLDETYKEYQYKECSFFPSDILKNVDPEVYHQGFLDFLNEEGYNEIERGKYTKINILEALKGVELEKKEVNTLECFKGKRLT